MDQLQGVALALIPSVGIGFLFYKVIRLILEGDRKERLAHSRWEAEHAEPGLAATAEKPAGPSHESAPVEPGRG